MDKSQELIRRFHMVVVFIILSAFMIVCAFMTFRASHLLISALWLAGCSALLSILLYILGAYQVAVIELSVGAGLVTVLFAFAISIAGNEATESSSILPKPLAFGLSLIAILLLGYMTISSLVALPATAEASFSQIVWQDRGLDMLVQSGLMFAAIVGMMGLLGDSKKPLHQISTDDHSGALPEETLESSAHPRPKELES
jgi:NADH:ubiquinone oxidoreductase subunit 6 (subunit J)